MNTKHVSESMPYEYQDSDLVVALVGAVGTPLKLVSDVLSSRLNIARYETTEVHVASDVIEVLYPNCYSSSDTQFNRIRNLMKSGNAARRLAKNNSILALGVSSQIAKYRINLRSSSPLKRRAFIVRSLKHPEEVDYLRALYGKGFYQIGVHADSEFRKNHLMHELSMSETEADKLIKIDHNEGIDHGQKVTDTYHLSNFFVSITSDSEELKLKLWRFIDIIFGHSHMTPFFDEHAMFLAYASSLHSSDLSRQVGAVLARDETVMASGANDSPKFGGGTYWPSLLKHDQGVFDTKDGRDYRRGWDSNRRAIAEMVDGILEELSHGRSKNESRKLRQQLINSELRNIGEFGRSVHAEMDVLFSCARNGISTSGGTLYTTVYPCHNCAKHIVAAGIKRVVFVEPYEKSRAHSLHNDSVALARPSRPPILEKVSFEPFEGIGPRRYFDLFSIEKSSGRRIVRKTRDGIAVKWNLEASNLRLNLNPKSYLEDEKTSMKVFMSLHKLLSNRKKRSRKEKK